jgi:hypothetical protein
MCTRYEGNCVRKDAFETVVTVYFCPDRPPYALHLYVWGIV